MRATLYPLLAKAPLLQVRELENELEKIAMEGKRLGLSKADLIELMEIYYEGE
jgi:GntR family transcriptional regulator